MRPIISLPCNEFLYEKISEQLEEALESELDAMENGDKFEVFIGLDTPYLDSPQEMLFFRRVCKGHRQLGRVLSLQKNDA